MKIVIIILWLMIIFPALCNSSDSDIEANIFWQRFKVAVIEDRVEEVASLTHFPFEVRGPVDSDPIFRYDKKKFPAILRKICSQHVEVQSQNGLVEKSMAEVVTEKKVLTSRDFLTSDLIRVHQFVFKRINGKWLFTRAYLEE